jgi:hypothetical protein
MPALHTKTSVNGCDKHLPTNKRTEWKVNLLTAAIEPNFRSSQKVFDERVTTFFREYWQFAETEFPDLGIKRMKQPSANSPWQEFSPRQLTKKYNYARTYHFFYPGPRRHYVCVEFTGLGAKMSTIIEANRDLVPDGIQWVLRQKKNVWLKTLVPNRRGSGRRGENANAQIPRFPRSIRLIPHRARIQKSASRKKKR